MRAVFFLAFTVPKGYEFKKDEVDKGLGMAKAKVDELNTKFQENVSHKLASITTMHDGVHVHMHADACTH